MGAFFYEEAEYRYRYIVSIQDEVDKNYERGLKMGIARHRAIKLKKMLQSVD